MKNWKYENDSWIHRQTGKIISNLWMNQWGFVFPEEIISRLLWHGINENTDSYVEEILDEALKTRNKK